MNYKPFPNDYWTLIQKTLDSAKVKNQKLIAAFDADGTLWDADLGENFFQYQIDHKSVALPKNAFEYYIDLKNKNNDPRDAFLWLAQINENQNIKTVRDWSQDAFDRIQPCPIFSEQKKLIQLLLQNSVDVYIVTASITWAVEPGAKALGLSINNVIGVETEIINEKITTVSKSPITYRKGKVEALLKRTHGVNPFLCSGNSMGDFELLSAATDIRIAVSAASRDDHIFKTEYELLEKAKNNNWLGHRFI